MIAGPDTADTIANAAAALSMRGCAVFPLLADKTPATKHGFEDAIKNNPERARWLCRGAALLGVATGEVSGFDVLDLDYPRHPEIMPWVDAWRGRLSGVRSQRTRSGGEHWLFKHRNGQRNTAGFMTSQKPQRQPGVDRRGDGGYIVWWPSSGFPVLNAAPLSEWPDWLLGDLDWKPPPPPASKYERKPIEEMHPSDIQRWAQVALDKSIERLARSSPGHRNNDLNSEAFYLSRKFVSIGALRGAEVIEALTYCAINMGLSALETGRTLDSAITAGLNAPKQGK